MTKKMYHLTYLNEEGDEEVIEIPAYSAEQAEFLSGKETVVGVEEAVSKSRRMPNEQ